MIRTGAREIPSVMVESNTSTVTLTKGINSCFSPCGFDVVGNKLKMSVCGFDKSLGCIMR